MNALLDVHIPLAPPPRMTVDEHAEKTFVLSERTSDVSGPLRLRHTPYLRFPMQCFTDPDITWIYLCCGTQMAKTTFLMAIHNYIVDVAPAPLMLHYPSMDSAKQVSKDRFQPLYDDCPDVGQHRTGVDDDFSVLTYKLDRMTVRYAWNSLISVSSHPEKYLIKDEIKDMDPLICKAAEDRTKNYSGRKIVSSSSPLHPKDNIWQPLGLVRDYELEEQVKKDQEGREGLSIPIRRWKHKEGSSVSTYQYYVPCPHCGEYQQLHADRIYWPSDCAIRDITHRAYYACEHCDGKIRDHHKRRMVQDGEWRCPNEGSSAVGFQISSLYSLLGDACSFGGIAAEYLRAHTSKRTSDLQAFINSYLCWPWEEEEFGDDAVNIGLMAETVDTYRKNEIPDEVLLLVIGADVHKNDIHYTVWGYSETDEYLISWGIYEVDMDHDAEDGLEHLKEVRGAEYKNGDRVLRCVGAAVDSGFRASTIYKWARDQKWIAPVKGQRGEVMVPDGLEAYIVSTKKIDKAPDGTPVGVILRNVNTGLIKRELYDGIRSGHVHFPVDVDQVVLNQLGSEKLVTRRNAKGKLQQFYVKKSRSEDDEFKTAKNHYLDTCVYARAMKEMLCAGKTVADAAVVYYQQKKKRKRRVSYSEQR